MAWVVGSTSGNWQVGTSTDPLPAFLLLQATEYRHGEPCTLQVIGADGSYAVRWSPTDDPSHADSVVLTVTGSELVDGLGTITVTAARGIVRYGTTGWLWLVQGADQTGLPVTLLAPAGRQSVVLAAPLADAGDRITAIPDLAATDQVSWWDVLPSGDVVIAADGSFNVDGAVESFSVEAHIDGVGYTAAATQTIGAFAPSVYVSAPIRSHTGSLLANQTGIHYTVRAGHDLAGEMIVSGTTGTTDAQGRFSLSNIPYPPAEPVAISARWLDGSADRFVIKYDQTSSDE